MKAKTVLIVDDDEDDREIFCDAVKEVNASVQCIACTGGQQALHLLRQEAYLIPDFIFVDLNMPRMNGKQCLMELKKLPGFNNVHLIMYTTSRLTDEIREAKKIGVHFIPKPSSFAGLRAIIADVFEQKWAEIDMLMK